ncbi:MAG: hypothetical protein E6Q97_15825 [Desulfurellales bacterium]|nr:MAG: hypothetical protein E6Q97_15825 [Desulfurellales bacterium]
MQEAIQLVQGLGLPVALTILLIYDWRNRDTKQAKQNEQLTLFIQNELSQMNRDKVTALEKSSAAIDRNTEAFERLCETLKHGEHRPC